MFISDLSIYLGALQVSTSRGYAEALGDLDTGGAVQSPIVWGWPAGLEGLWEDSAVGFASLTGASVVASDVSRDLCFFAAVTELFVDTNGNDGTSASHAKPHSAVELMSASEKPAPVKRVSHYRRAATKAAAPPSPPRVALDGHHTVAILWSDGDNL